MVEVILTALFIVHVYLIGMAFYYAYKTHMYSSGQLILQGVVAVVFPLIGALLIIGFSINQINRKPHLFHSSQDPGWIDECGYFFLSKRFVKASEASLYTRLESHEIDLGHTHND